MACSTSTGELHERVCAPFGFAVLVAIFTIEGSARFALCQTRAGEILQEWEAGPGSVTLLRGPGLLT